MARQTIERKQVVAALAALEGWRKPVAYLDSFEHYDVSARGENKSEWLRSVTSGHQKPYLVGIHLGGYTSAHVAVAARNSDEALETADEWAATRYYKGDSERMYEMGEGVQRVELLTYVPRANKTSGRRRPKKNPAPDRMRDLRKLTRV